MNELKAKVRRAQLWIKGLAAIWALSLASPIPQAYASLEFNRAEVGELAVVVASAQGFGASSFGHAFLRIQRKAGTWAANDYVIEIAANNGQEGFSAFRGLGLIKPYPAKMSVISYARMLDLKTREELRDLDNYVLDLTPEQRDKALAYIEKLATQDKVGDYAFLSQNCASYVSDILNEAGITLLHGLWANVPSQLPSKLEELGFIKSKFTDRSAGTIRTLLLQKFPSPSISNPEVALLWPSLKKQLGSEVLHERILGYLKLHYIVRLNDSAEDLKKQARSLLRQFIMQEAVDLRTDLRKTFLEESGAAAIHVFPLFNKTLPLSELRAVRGLKLEGDKFGSYVRVENASAYNSAQDGVPPTDERVEFHKLRFDHQSGLFYFGASLMGAQLSDHVWDDEFFTPGVSLFHEVIKMPSKSGQISEQVLVYAVVDETREFSPLKWNSEDYLDFSNMEIAMKFGNAGACVGVAQLQETFYLRAVFRPEMPRLADLKSYLKLVERMLMGDYILIPGFSNLRELTQTLDRQALMTFAVQLSEQYNQFGHRVSQWFKSQSMNEETIADMTKLGKLGIPTMMRFLKKKSPYSHVFLVQSVTESLEGYTLASYDPNWKQSVSSIDKEEFEIHSKFYPDFESPRLYPVNLREKYSDLQRKRKLLTPEFLQYAAQTGQFVFTATEIGVY